MGLQRHVGDFVQIERAVMGKLEQPGLVRALGLLDAEQLGLDPVRRHGGAIDRHKGIGGAARTSMDQARRDFLARTGGAGDQHPAVGGRDLLDQGAQLRDHGGLADQFAIVAGLELQFLHFALQPRRFQRPLHHMQQPVGLERLFDEVIGALLDRGDRGLDGAMARDHHHRHIRLLALQGIQYLDAVQPRALQPDIENDQLRPARRVPPPARLRCRPPCASHSPRPAECPRSSRECPPRRPPREFQTRSAIRFCSSSMPF